MRVPRRARQYICPPRVLTFATDAQISLENDYIKNIPDEDRAMFHVVRDLFHMQLAGPDVSAPCCSLAGCSKIGTLECIKCGRVSYCCKVRRLPESRPEENAPSVTR